MVLLQILVKNMETKNSIRKELLKLRKEMLEYDVRKKSHIITQKVIALEVFQKAEHIFLYSPTQNEVDTKELFLNAILHGKKVYYPRVNETNSTMNFYEVKTLEQLACGAYGILEPSKHCKPFQQITNSCMIVPGVAFHKNGNRIGYGKGFYDRFLAKYTDISTVGICFDLQMTDKMPFEAFDVQLEYVITERME